MTSAQRRSLIALAVGVIAALLTWYFFPGAPFWVYAIEAVVLMGGTYQTLLKQDALHRIADK